MDNLLASLTPRQEKEKFLNEIASLINQTGGSKQKHRLWMRDTLQIIDYINQKFIVFIDLDLSLLKESLQAADNALLPRRKKTPFFGRKKNITAQVKVTITTILTTIGTEIERVELAREVAERAARAEIERVKAAPIVEKRYPELKCPITKGLMRDPVTTTDGHTYERAAIEKSLLSNNRSPSTHRLMTNFALRNIIERQLKSESGDTIEEHPELNCSITLDPMVDPVITADGHTYERAAIERSLLSNNRSPITGAPLEDNSLVDNIVLRQFAEHMNAEKAAAEKAGAEKAGAEKAAEEKAGAEKAAEEKAGAEKAAEEKAAAEKAAAEKAAAEKAAEEKAAAEKAAEEKAGAEKAAEEKAAAEKAAEEKAAEEKAAAENATGEQATEEKRSVLMSALYSLVITSVTEGLSPEQEVSTIKLIEEIETINSSILAAEQEALKKNEWRSNLLKVQSHSDQHVKNKLLKDEPSSQEKTAAEKAIPTLRNIPLNILQELKKTTKDNWREIINGELKKKIDAYFDPTKFANAQAIVTTCLQILIQNNQDTQALIQNYAYAVLSVYIELNNGAWLNVEGTATIMQKIAPNIAVDWRAEYNELNNSFCAAYCHHVHAINLNALLQALKENKTLISLYLWNYEIGDAGATAFAEALKENTTLTSLVLDANNIGDAGAIALAEALTTNTTLTSLDLRGNNIGAAGATAFAEALKKNTTLTSLVLRGNNIGDAGAKDIALALKENTTLTALGLVDNNIGAAGAKDIALALKGNTTLASLNLRWDNIGDAGAIALAEALKDNTTLTSLDLVENYIGAAGATALVEALKNNTTLTSFNLESTEIGDAGAIALAEALTTNTTLTSLDLSTNQIGDAGATALAKAVARKRIAGYNIEILGIDNFENLVQAEIDKITNAALKIQSAFRRGKTAGQDGDPVPSL